MGIGGRGERKGRRVYVKGRGFEKGDMEKGNPKSETHKIMKPKEDDTTRCIVDCREVCYRLNERIWGV